MKHKPAWALALTLVALSGCTTAPPRDQGNLCNIYRQYPRWYEDSLAMQSQWGTPPQVAMAIMKQESSFVADALPPRAYLLWVIPWGRVSPSYGYAQAQPPAWSDFEEAPAKVGRGTTLRTPSALSAGIRRARNSSWGFPSGMLITSIWPITKVEGATVA